MTEDSDHPANQAYRRSFRGEVSKTYLENWPAKLRALSIPSIGFTLQQRERSALLAAFWLREGESAPDDVLKGMGAEDVKQELRNIAERIDDGLKYITNKTAFIRLGSRSPKDAWLGYREGFEVRSGKKGVELLLDSMERIWDDLSLDHACEAESYIWLRDWINLPKWAEFRCIMNGGMFLGASQYDYQKSPNYPEINQQAVEISGALSAFSIEVAAACHMQDYIFDVGFLNGDLSHPILIEINPFGPLTDKCLFQKQGWPTSPIKPAFAYVGDGNEYGRNIVRSDPDPAR